MKLQKVEFKNHKILKNLEINFCHEDGSPLNTVVIIGDNGSGKTTLLKSIYETFRNRKEGYKSINNSQVTLNTFTTSVSIQVEKKEEGMLKPDYPWDVTASDAKDPKLVYMPTEINFEKMNKVDNTFRFTPDFINIINQSITENIPSLIATKINKEIFKNRNEIIGTVINKVCKSINSVFASMDMDAKLIGLSEDEDTKPIFKNSLGDEFDISGLSSGEKQLFLRALSLKFLEVNNSIILIDEPEISLHPTWQQKIIKVYENIGENNQIIIATHSPHIVGDIEAKQLRIMKKCKDGITIVEPEEIDETYGQNVESILRTTMNMDKVRNEDVSNKLDKIFTLLNNDFYDTQEFKDTFNYLRKYLGDLDKDIMRIKLEETRRRKKTNVEGK